MGEDGTFITGVQDNEYNQTQKMPPVQKSKLQTQSMQRQKTADSTNNGRPDGKQTAATKNYRDVKRKPYAAINQSEHVGFK